MKLLILLVVVVGVIALVQLARVYEMANRLRKTREEDISHADNRMNAVFWIIFMIGFYASVIYLYAAYGDYLPPSASAHGVGLDALMSVNIWIITAVFFLVNTALFVFAFRYHSKEGRKAKFFPHDNRLELIWTVIPSIVLAGIIIFGLRTWNDMTGPASDDAMVLEIYSKQFDWTARYAGDNNEFGLSDFNLISTMNPLGLVTADAIGATIEDIDAQIAVLEEELDHERGVLVEKQMALEDELDHMLHHDHEAPHHHHGPVKTVEEIRAELAKVETMLNSDKVSILTEAAYEAKEEKVYRLQRHKQRILDIEKFDYESNISAWEAGMDDKIVKGEFHLPVGKEVEFVFRSRDVIHSAYMPHFRTQMNTVPGIPTRFKMTPTITTDSMRTILDDPDFDYVLLCNKVCGAAHFNMKMKVVIESEDDYNKWLNEQDEFIAEETEEGATEEAPSAEIEKEEEEEVITASLK